MTIEFHCPHCSKLLKTPDDKAGVRANCPGCGELVTVPSLADEVAQADPTLAQAAPRDGVGQEIHASESPAESESEFAGETKACPMCGKEIKRAALRCRFCGEGLDSQPTADGTPTKIEAGDVLSRAWQVYQTHLGILIGAFLISFGIKAAVYMASQAIQFGIQLAVFGALRGGNPIPALIAIYGISFVLMIVQFAIASFVDAGYCLLLLRVVRGENFELADMFSGGRFFWRFFWGNILFALMYGLGLILLIVPGILVLLAFWPFLYVIVDRNVGVMESFKRSVELTSGNYGACFIIALATLGINLLGLLAICFGLIFSIPLTVLMFTVAYCLMSGQHVAIRQGPS